VSLISNGPTDDWEFEAGLSFEFVADEFVGHAIASGPITDVFGFRLAYQGSTMEGFLKNDAKPAASPFFVPGNPFAQEPFSFPGALDDRKGASDEHIARLTLTYEPTDRFDATLKILATTYDDDGANVNEVISCSSGGNSITSPVASGITAVDPNSDCKLDGHTSQGAFPPEISASFPNASAEGGDNYGEYDSQIVTLNMNYELDNVTISAQVGWHYYDWLRFDNFDGTTFWQLGGIQDEESTVWSTEIRVLTTFDSPLNFMFGGFYENTDRDSDNFGKIAAVGADPTTGFSNNWSGVSTIEGDTLSGFGQLIWDVNERLELTAGARFTDEDKDMIQGNVFVNPQMLFLLRPVGLFGNDFDDTNWSPEVTVTWKATDDVTLYGAFKTGYKSGGFSTNTVITAGTTGQDVTFDEETSGGFEVGAKARLLEGALRANLTLYRYIFDDLQVQAFDSATTSFSIRNAAEAKTEGFELDVQWLATQALAVRGQVGFNSGRYEDFKGAPTFRGQGGGTQDLTDDPLLFAPDWNWSVGFNYDRSIGSAGLMLGLTGDVIFQDDYETMLQENPLSTQDSYFKLNASVRLSWPERGWEIALIGRNLTNERYLGSTADKPGGLPGDVFGDAIRARQVILQGTVNF
jgi:outer membrane receptor protein involved in Fe transport